MLRITMIDRLPEDAQTLYAETIGLLLALERGRGWSHLSGSFSTKSVKGGEYVYFQYSDPGGTKRQLFIGRRDSTLDELIRSYEEQRGQGTANRQQITRLAGLLRAAGAAVLPHAPHRMIGALADAGVFASGGVLMGSYAFLVLGNVLGIRWPAATWRTQDVDLAAHLEVAVPQVMADVPSALECLKRGFVPVPQLDPRNPSTSFRVRGRPLSVDLITPGTDADDSPIMIRRFNAAAAPIKYLGLAMDEALPAAAFESSAATLLMVPSPARFALHKLLVSQSRAAIHQTKTGKDLHQAALLLEALGEDRPEDLEQAARAFSSSGPVVTRRVQRGLRSALQSWPDAAAGAAIVERHIES